MIPLNFYLFWAGAKLSYLRYLTFKTLRHFHPESEIVLYTASEYNKSVHSWGSEKQDFESDNGQIDYIDELPKINVDIKRIKYVYKDACPVFQSDLARWIMLKENGGFYLDTDQIILKSFSTLPLDKEFIYCRYNEVQCGDYLPTGVLGLEKESPIADMALEEVAKGYSPNNYNSSGPFMMRSLIKKIDLSRSFKAPFHYFYPINSSKDVGRIYDGRVVDNLGAYSLHWFGGHPLSQEFNKKYTEDFAKTSKDFISMSIRGI